MSEEERESRIRERKRDEKEFSKDLKRNETDPRRSGLQSCILKRRVSGSER
jgi:hypothetical protein